MSLDAGLAAGLGTVRVVGTGLLGTSVALGLAHSGVRVLLADPSPTALALARDLGAGVIDDAGEPCTLIVVAAPPDVTADVVLAELAAHPSATVTDVASVKNGVLQAVRAAGADLSRYVGSHPMAGRERSGAVSARGDLFLGRPWVVCPPAAEGGDRVDQVRRLALALGAVPVTMTAEQHDAAVAVVSHVPQIASSLVAARLTGADDDAIALAGTGLRDVTRIAASDPMLWAQILAANAGPVLAALRALSTDLDDVIAALAAIAAEDDPSLDQSGDLDAGAPAGHAPGATAALGARARIARAVAAGNLGRERIPGKHGGSPTRYRVVTVLVPDQPGSLGRLFADIGAAGVNIEELSLEHAPGRAVGLLEVSVVPGTQGRLEAALSAGGWHVVA